MVEVCGKVLALEPDNVKALLRRGGAFLKLRDSERSQADLQRRAPSFACAPCATQPHACCSLCNAG